MSPRWPCHASDLVISAIMGCQSCNLTKYVLDFFALSVPHLSAASSFISLFLLNQCLPLTKPQLQYSRRHWKASLMNGWNKTRMSKWKMNLKTARDEPPRRDRKIVPESRKNLSSHLPDSLRSFGTRMSRIMGIY